MKKITLFLGIALITFSAQAQITLTHSVSQAITANSAACPTPPTRFQRSYDLVNEFSIFDDFQIISVEFGVQIAETSGTVPLNIYTADGTDPTTATLTSIFAGVAVATVADQGTVVSYTLPTPITVPAGSILVVEVVDNLPAPIFRIGSNSAGETAPSYLNSDACGAGTVNSFPGFDNDYVINVIGDLVLSVDSNLLTQVSIYPNPAKDVLNLKIPASIEIIKASLYDVLGRNTAAKVVNNQINVSNLSKGIYMLSLETSAGKLTQKIVKQ